MMRGLGKALRWLAAKAGEGLLLAVLFVLCLAAVSAFLEYATNYRSTMAYFDRETWIYGGGAVLYVLSIVPALFLHRRIMRAIRGRARAKRESEQAPRGSKEQDEK